MNYSELNSFKGKIPDPSLQDEFQEQFFLPRTYVSGLTAVKVSEKDYVIQ